MYHFVGSRRETLGRFGSKLAPMANCFRADALMDYLFKEMTVWRSLGKTHRLHSLVFLKYLGNLSESAKSSQSQMAWGVGSSWVVWKFCWEIYSNSTYLNIIWNGWITVGLMYTIILFSPNGNDFGNIKKRLLAFACIVYLRTTN